MQYCTLKHPAWAVCNVFLCLVIIIVEAYMSNNTAAYAEYTIQADDGTDIFVRRWLPAGGIRAAVQISHGMVEHSGRYEWFANKLAEQGFAVYAHDHRGHGKTAKTAGSLGYLADKNGFDRVVNDVRCCIEQIRTAYPDAKVILFGHSFGSFVAQRYMEQYGNTIDGCILSGTAGPRLALVRTARVIAAAAKVIGGPKKCSRFINALAFGSSCSRIQDKRTRSDWLSRDSAQVDAYIADPLCQFTPTSSFFYDLFDGLCTIHTKEQMRRIPVSLPIFLFAGTADPVGSYGKTVQVLYDVYRNNGVSDLELKLYPGARHELLNEINREEALADILSWLNKRF